MGNFSRDTFDKLKHYVGVRLQQGVPIVDADWNELEDIRRFELEAFLRWFVGNGVPYGNDGFRIVPRSDDNDFEIKGGEPGRAGRILVDGWDVLNEVDMPYTEQQLYAPEPSPTPPTFDEEARQKWHQENAQREEALAKAADWGVDPLPPLSPSTEWFRRDLVYLDVWEREVNSTEDPDLVDDRIGVETCVRRKREWVVRVLEGSTELPEPKPDIKGNRHVSLPLAVITRPKGASQIRAEDIEDLRLTGLRMPSTYDFEQIVRDAFGGDYTLDHDGRPNLSVSLREAVNAVMRGGYPTTPEERLWPAFYSAASSAQRGSIIGLDALRDRNGDIWLFWNHSRTGIHYKRYRSKKREWDEEKPVDIEVPAVDFFSVLEDPDGVIWLFWSTTDGEERSICYKRFLATGESDEEKVSLELAPGSPYFAVVTINEEIWLIWAAFVKTTVYGEEESTINWSIMRKKFSLPLKQWNLNEESVHTQQHSERSHLYVDKPEALVSRNQVFLFWKYSVGYGATSYIVGGILASNNDSLKSEDKTIGASPAACLDSQSRDGLFWVFFVSESVVGETGREIRIKKINPKDIESNASNFNLTKGDQIIEESVISVRYSNLKTLMDSDAGLWLFFERTKDDSRAIAYRRRYRSAAAWGSLVELVGGLEDPANVVTVEDSNKLIWVFYKRKIDQKQTICCKTILKEI